MDNYINSGKEILHMNNDDTVYTHIADAGDNEKAHFLATAANVFSFDYIAECDKTCSPMFNPENVDLVDFVHVLREFIGTAELLNLYKKALFRGKTAKEVGLRSPFPGQSMGEQCPQVQPIGDLMHGTIGIATEAGELCEMLLAVIREDKRPDKVNAIEEIGDQMWYQSRVLKWAGVSFAQAQKINIDKLHGRHGESFSLTGDNNRDLEAERAKLESGIGEPIVFGVSFDSGDAGPC